MRLNEEIDEVLTGRISELDEKIKNTAIKCKKVKKEIANCMIQLDFLSEVSLSPQSMEIFSINDMNLDLKRQTLLKRMQELKEELHITLSKEEVGYKHEKEVYLRVKSKYDQQR
ncbi:hypothetical protein ABU952_05750 [Bacillus amyloliquefaciens]|uniref:hypothetical protein n=1 Tax=Bacillus amyloliquefaciens TaxID=1390 RepID=UPI00336BA9CB